MKVGKADLSGDRGRDDHLAKSLRQLYGSNFRV